MGAGCCISEFVDVRAGVRPVQADDGELEQSLFRAFASRGSYTAHTFTGCISTVSAEDRHFLKADMTNTYI